MYYIGNVRYFLTKKKFALSAINEIVEKLGKESVNNMTGDQGFVSVGSVREFLDTDTAFAFTRAFNNDQMQVKIALAKGVIPVIPQMSQNDILDRMIEMEAKNPEMFNHQKAKSNEVWLGDQLVDFVHVNVAQYKRNGVPSVRIDPEPIMKPVEGLSGVHAYYSVFADAQELIKAEYETKQIELI